MLRDRDQTFPNCLRTERQIPVELTADRVDITIDVADDLAEAGQRVAGVELSQRLAAEIPLELTDVELSIRYAFPNGPWEGTPD